MYIVTKATVLKFYSFKKFIATYVNGLQSQNGLLQENEDLATKLMHTANIVYTVNLLFCLQNNTLRMQRQNRANSRNRLTYNKNTSGTSKFLTAFQVKIMSTMELEFLVTTEQDTMKNQWMFQWLPGCF